MKIYCKILWILIFGVLFGFFSEAKPIKKNMEDVVRVGYFVNDSGMFGGEHCEPRAGYFYEYLQRIAGYAGWKYEYVEGSYYETLKKLKNGEIDIMVDVIHLPECENEILYSSFPLGMKRYSLGVPETNVNIQVADDVNGLTIALIGGSYGEFCVKKYIQEKGFQCNILACKDGKEINDALIEGKADCIAIPDGAIKQDGSFYNTFKLRMIDVIDPGKPFSFAVSKSRPYLLKRFDTAIQNIRKNDPEYFDRIYAKYVRKYPFSGFTDLSEEDKEWIIHKNIIKVGYLKDFMPFCWTDREGDFRGVFREIFDDLNHRFSFQYEAVVFLTYEDMLASLKEGKIDVVASAIGSPWFAECNGVAITPPIATTPLRIITRKNYKFQTNIKCAVNDESIFQKQYIMEHHPEFTPIYFSSNKESLQAILDGRVDVMYMSEGRFEALFHEHEDWFSGLNYSLAQDEFIRISMAVRPGDADLLSVLDCGLKTIDQGIVHAGIVEGFRYNETVTFSTFVRTHAVGVTTFFFVLLLGFGICAMGFICQERRHSHKLEVAEERARWASDAKSAFLSKVSHDIRTPMNAIMGMSTFIMRDINDPKKVAGHMSKIMASSRILLGLVNDILDSSAIESGKMRLVNEPLDLQACLTEVHSIYQAQCMEKEIQFDVKYKNVTETHLIGDRKRLAQIEMNLLSNAFKFTEKGGQITILVEQTENKRWTTEGRIAVFRFSIQDTGCGIREDKIEKIFDPFEQGGDEIIFRHGGSGLGLNIVKNLVEMMRGTIRVESKEGVGTTFTIEIPFLINEHYVEEEKKEGDAIQNQNMHYDFTGKRILIADDDEFNREVIEGLLEMVGAEVVKAEDGRKALELFTESDEGHFHALLLDVHMPIMGGHEVATKIRLSHRKDSKSIAIFSLTADAFPEDAQKSKESGMTGHMTKPISQRVLYATLGQYLS